MIRVIRIPMKLPSLANARGCWQKKARIVKNQRSVVGMYLLAGPEKPPMPVTVTLTRFSPGKLDSGDNLAGAFKAVRDQIAKFYGVDDGSEQYEWQYRQVKQKEYGIEIRIETNDERRKDIHN